MESSIGGPFGTLIAGLGMGGYYVGLIWINLLLAILTNAMFSIPTTWVMDALQKRKAAKAEAKAVSAT